ncbi:unnamed protein product, partial [Closterium sp. NIES-65]
MACVPCRVSASSLNLTFFLLYCAAQRPLHSTPSADRPLLCVLHSPRKGVARVVHGLLLQSFLPSCIVLPNAPSTPRHPQIAHSFASFTVFPEKAWHSCRMSLQGCNQERLDLIHAYRDEMVEKVSPLLSSNRSASPVRRLLAAASSESSANGAYLVSCRAHCMAMGPMWHGSTAPRIHNK